MLGERLLAGTAFLMGDLPVARALSFYAECFVAAMIR